MALDMKGKRPFMLIVATPCMACVTGQGSRNQGEPMSYTIYF